MTNKPIIAIDGPAASGKGTLARALADHMGYAYLDTGKLYRAVGFAVLEQGGNPDNKDDALKAIESFQNSRHCERQRSNPDDAAEDTGLLRRSTPRNDEGKSIMDALNNPRLKDDDIAAAASSVARIPEVREALKDIQRDFAREPGEGFAGSVLDGRDIGTVICPGADAKLFIKADLEVRAKRRFKELQNKGLSVTYEAVLSDMQARDDFDQNRSVAPLKPADDAETLDTSAMSAGEVLDQALKILKSKGLYV